MPARADGEVNVYTYRQPSLIEPLFEAFTARTGISVRAVFADNGLVERLAQEGRNSPADLLLTADVGRLVEAAGRDLAQPVTLPSVIDKIPANLRDPGNQWFGLTMRARVVYASVDRVPAGPISYEELADPKWKGKICLRPGNHPYNLGLIAAMIAHKGEDGARAWLKGLKDNLAIKPSGNDRSQAKSVFAGECDLAIANTYYMGKMLTNDEGPEQKDWAKAVKIVFPSSPEFGTHVNISGMLLTKNAPNKDNALKLMEYPGQRRGPAPLCRRQFRVSGQSGGGALRDRQVLGQLHAGYVEHGRNRQAGTGGRQAGGRSGVQRLRRMRHDGHNSGPIPLGLRILGGFLPKQAYIQGSEINPCAFLLSFSPPLP